MTGDPSLASVPAGESEPEEGELPEQPNEPNSLPDSADGLQQAPAPFEFKATRAPFFWDQASQRAHKRKEKKKQKKKAAAGAGAGFVDVYGPQARGSLKVHPEEGPIRVSDVQNLLLWVLAEGTNPRWCFVKNKPLVKRVVVLGLHGLDAEAYQEKKHLIPSLGRLMGEPVELQARNPTIVPAQTVHSLFTVPQTKKRRRGEEQQPRAQQPGQQASPAAAAAAAREEEGGAPMEQQPAAASQHQHQNGGCGPGAGEDAVNGAAPPAKLQRLRAGGDVSTSGAVAEEAVPSAPSQPIAAAAAAAPQPSQAPKFVKVADGGSGGGDTSSGGGVRRSRPFPSSHYVLTLDEMQQHNYPLPTVGEAGEMLCPEGFVATEPCGGTPVHAMVGLDCEMCITEAGFELTRATVIDEEGQVLMDELVVPDNPITDYNTRYSGITAEMLAGVTTRLADVQARLQGLVSAETLVVTHSGENDFRALKVIHANVLDTSVLFPHPRGPPYKSALRVLASRHLLRTIQRESHDPVEDAKAALDLALLKIERGPGYGVASGEGGEKLGEVLTEHGRRCTLVDSQASLNKHVTGNCSAVVAEGDAAVMSALGREAAKPGCDYAWGQLLGLHRAYENRAAALREAGQPEPSELAEAPQFVAEQEGVLREWEGQLAALWDALEPGTLAVVLTGQGDTVYTRYLQEQKYRRQQGLDGMPAWSPECEELLAAANARAVCALCFAAVK